ncbi:thiamine biosynthesis protein ApbE [Rhizobium sp. R72]|uniref:FAD:protein FMN transferase n=1 Tax=unclassified Rhizobium TaxID=2613769 RepID=UPI000B534F5B|nr:MULTISPECIES: FAD:protein FMN transferase [unclassified Rhizobium]OWV98648.1 thiamine biosynthesis protein ApbE [Rhizobium sp. R72]OWV98682.1 thiamine biosynthesis protein ApbE [Rhizobium sp. R711]
MDKVVTRRRAIGIFAAAGGLPLLLSATAARPSRSTIVWNGQALGAPAKLILNDDDAKRAERLIETIVVEVARLEKVFSLYRDDSSLVELNRVGGLAAPPPELLALLEKCSTFFEATGGLFDPTVQPVWKLYRDHFASTAAGEDGPDKGILNARLRRVGFDALRFGAGRIAFSRPQMAITLNGVAQGFITDRVVDMLRDAGITSSLVDMGEACAIGAQSDGNPWRVGLASGEDSSDPDTVLPIVNRAVATSSQTGFSFDEAGRFGHILHPRMGVVPRLYRRVSVVAKDAASADALSTAFNLMEANAIRDTLDKFPDVSVDLVDLSGIGQRMGQTLSLEKPHTNGG